jgi:hypothetical protein
MATYHQAIKDLLKNASFNNKKVLHLIKNQTLTTTGMDSENMIMTFEGLQTLKFSMDKKNVFGNTDHYFSGSPKLRMRNIRIEEVKEIHHLKADIDVLDFETLERMKSRELKGMSVSFTQK